MPGIFLYTGNRLELLADKFAELLQTRPLPPLEKEVVVEAASKVLIMELPNE